MSDCLEDVNKLTEAQRAALDEMKVRFSSYPEAYFRDEYFLLHWLIARKFDVNNAEIMLVKHYRCRKANGMDAPEYRQFQPNHIMDKYYPHGVLNHDKNGRPVAYFPIGGIDAKGIIHNVKSSDMFRAVMFWQEQRKWNCEYASKRCGKRIQQATYIIDLKGLSAKHLWKPGLDAFQDIAHFVEQHTPEIMHKLFIINAPALFPIIYKLIKPVLDENTRNKIQIYGEDFKKALLDIIDAKELPVCYGGEAVGKEDDPACRNHITYGGDVPQELYHNLEDECPKDLNWIDIRVKAGAQIFVPVIVDNEGSVLEWFVKSDSLYDFFFAVYFDAESEIDKPVDRMEMVYPYFKTVACFVPESGRLVVEKCGKYVLQFDNSHSWFICKNLKYAVRISDALEEIANL